MPAFQSLSSISEPQPMARFIVTRDTWLSEQMARPVGRVGLATDERPGLTIDAEAASELRNLRFAYAKLPVSAIAEAQRLEAAGFRLVDVTVELTAKEVNDAIPASGFVRAALPNDAAAVTEIARSSFTWSRFHQDPSVPKRQADDLKAAWALNYFRGQRGDHMVVAEIDGDVVGFNQLLRLATGELIIDLIAVAARARSRGLAAAMIAFASRTWGPGLGMRVGTQLANAGSIALYRRMGFCQSGASIVLHRHRNDVQS